MLTQTNVLEGTAVEILHGDGSVHIVGLDRVQAQHEKVLKTLAKEEAYRPCGKQCGVFPCPPGSNCYCCASADTTPNSSGALYDAQVAYVRLHGEVIPAFIHRPRLCKTRSRSASKEACANC